MNSTLKAEIRQTLETIQWCRNYYARACERCDRRRVCGMRARLIELRKQQIKEAVGG